MSAPKSLARAVKVSTKPTASSGAKHKNKYHSNRAAFAKATSSEAANHMFRQAESSSVLDLSTKQVLNVIGENSRAGKLKQNLRVASTIRNDPLGTRFRTPEIYLSLLQHLAAENARKRVPLALNLFVEMSRIPNCPPDQLEKAQAALFACFEVCSNYTQLLSLKIVFQSVISRQDASSDVALRYLGIHMHVLLNSGQVQLAVTHFSRCLEQIQENTRKASLLRRLPLQKFLAVLCSTQDCDTLTTVLSEIISHDCIDVLDVSAWSEILGLALWKNDYNLTKLIYEHVLMDGIEPSVLEDAVLEIGLTQNNPLLTSLSEKTLTQILHTLATNGDVRSCLHLIEWHYVHKSLQGEQTLTKDLCLQVIRAYCFYNPNPSTLADRDDDDASVKVVMDVIDSLVSKNRHVYDYTDVVDAFSHKLNTYHAYDSKVANSVAKEASAPFIPISYGHDFGETVPEEVLITKRSNQNIRASPQGSVLKNTRILQDFIIEHLHHMAAKNFSSKTRQIVINCLLAHLTTYQNATGVIIALKQMSLSEENFMEKWLDPPSYEIITRSFSASPAAMMTGLTFHEHMKRNHISISQKTMKNLIISSLHGVHYNALLEYYVYEYLHANPEPVSSYLLNRIAIFKSLNEEGKLLLTYLESFSKDKHANIDRAWESYGFNKVAPTTIPSDEEYAHYHAIDERDRAALERILAQGN
ncbi:hypothetical protein OXX80_001353 [Metschnikowia pulcherrima]